jgi:hypothetical protein
MNETWRPLHSLSAARALHRGRHEGLASRRQRGRNRRAREARREVAAAHESQRRCLAQPDPHWVALSQRAAAQTKSSTVSPPSSGWLKSGDPAPIARREMPSACPLLRDGSQPRLPHLRAVRRDAPCAFIIQPHPASRRTSTDRGETEPAAGASGGITRSRAPRQAHKLGRSSASRRRAPRSGASNGTAARLGTSLGSKRVAT